MEKNVYLFVCDDLADWEPALAVAMISDRYPAIPRKHAFKIITFGLTQAPIKSFGGLTVIPDTTFDAIDPGTAAMIILPGSSLYEKNDPVQLVPLIEACVRFKVPIAAICGGTLFLARHGFLNVVRHTSAGPAFSGSTHPLIAGNNCTSRHPVLKIVVSSRQTRSALSSSRTLSSKRWMSTHRSFGSSGSRR